MDAREYGLVGGDPALSTHICLTQRKGRAMLIMDTSSTRFAALIRLTFIVVLGFAVALGLIGLLTHIPVLIMSTGITLTFAGALRIAHRYVARNNRTLAAYWIAGGALIAVALLTSIVPPLYISNAVVPLLVATVLLQYAPYEHCRRYLGICGLMTVGIVTLGVTLPHPLVAAQLLTYLNISLLITNVGVALFLLWQFRMRLQETILHVQETNTVLNVLNNRLQRELHEHQRTEAALHTSDRRMRALLNAIPDVLFRLSADGHVLDVKPIESMTIALGSVSVPTTEIQSLLPPSAWIERAIKTRQLQRYESQLVIKNEVHEYEGRLMVSDDNEVVAIVRDVTDVKRVERLKMEFVATVSHELRTPLTAIYGSLGLIAGGVTGDLSAQTAALVKIAYKNSERLLRLINDLLDLEKSEAGRLEFAMQPLALLPLVEQAIETNRPFGAQFGVTFTFVQPAPDVWVNGDSNRLTQVLTNLLSNAAKFSPSDDSVRIAVTAHDQTVRVAITNHGPAIAESFRDRIFMKFAQADTSDSRQRSGTGLGLSISKAIIERFGGVMSYETGDTTGTTFYFDLPVYHSEPAATAS
jgi:signal transduction histidine kinase